MRKRKLLLVIILIVAISIGFSAISSSLSIIGNSSIARNTWDVHFENVQVKSGSVGANPPVISNNDTQVTYNVTLNMPGDYYEFTVDAVNEGSIDAMIQTFSNTGLTTAQQKYLDYYITYDDGIEVANKHLLAHGSTEKYKVRVNYKADLDPDDLPDSDQSINLTFSVTYEQADSTAVILRKYVVSSTNVFIGQSIPDTVNARLTPTEAMNVWMGVSGYISPFYIKHIMSNDIVLRNYVEFEVTPELLIDNPEIVVGTYSLRGGINESSEDNKPIYEENKATLLNTFGSTYCTESYFDAYGYSILYCRLSYLYVSASDNGNVDVHDFTAPYWNECRVDRNGFSYCERSIHE